MIDDFGVGRRPARPVVSQKRPLQYSQRFNQSGNDVDAIALAMSPNQLHGSLPAPVQSFLSNSGDSLQPDNSDGGGNRDGGENRGEGNSSDGGNNDKRPKDRWYKRLFGSLAGKLSRRQWLMVAAVFVLLVGGGISYALTRPEPVQNAATTKAKLKPKPLPPPPPVSPLTGLEVSAEDAKHIVTGVMIENSTNARPQSGLQQAGVVYEAIAEYGITRFLALFQEAKPENVGPVRSVRPYYVDWSKSYDAPIAHVGGSPDALQKIKAENVKDLDQFFNAGAYRRVNSRFAPHNVYTTMQQLNDNAKAKGWTTSQFTGWPRKKDSPSKTPNANKVDIAISSPTYNVHYDYDPAANRYLRVMAGAPHIDADNKQQITPKVVIAIVTDYGLEPDGYHSRYRVTGNGSALIFQDGMVTPATWSRPDAASQYSFLGADNKPVKLNAGQAWVTMVGSAGAVTHAP